MDLHLYVLVWAVGLAASSMFDRSLGQGVVVWLAVSLYGPLYRRMARGVVVWLTELLIGHPYRRLACHIVDWLAVLSTGPLCR